MVGQIGPLGAGGQEKDSTRIPRPRRARRGSRDRRRARLRRAAPAGRPRRHARHGFRGRRPGRAPLRGGRRPRRAARAPAHVGAPDAGIVAVLHGPLSGDLRLGLRPRPRDHDAHPVPVAARDPARGLPRPGISARPSRSPPSTAPRVRSPSLRPSPRPDEDYVAACDAIQRRVLPLKRLVGATALVIAALIVIS